MAFKTARFTLQMSCTTNILTCSHIYIIAEFMSRRISCHLSCAASRRWQPHNSHIRIASVQQALEIISGLRETRTYHFQQANPNPQLYKYISISIQFLKKQNLYGKFHN